MATTISTPAHNHFSTSTSSFRTSRHNAPMPLSPYANSPLTQLPHIDFNFDDLRARMTAFTAKFDAFIERGRKRVLEERNEFRGRIGELGEDAKSTTSQISTLQTSLSSQTSLQSRNTAERADILSSISTLSSHHESATSTCTRLRAQISHTQSHIDRKIQAQRDYAAKQAAQSGLNGPELGFWESMLGMRIEGSGREDVVRVVFVFAPAKSGGTEGEREAQFELKVPERGGYEVLWCKPVLEGGKVSGEVGRLNESRDLGTFLKGMRGLFAECAK